jgi:hypothetical protein
MNEISVFRVLEDFQRVQERLDPSLFVLALLASLAASYLAVFFYRFFYESRGTGSQVHRSFPLLGISITTLFIGVQMSIPLSLGLLGALSIIRFRTPIKEPEEVGFIMLVIASAISSATFNFRYMVILYVVAFLSLLITRGVRTWKFLRRDGVLVVTTSDADAGEAMEKIREHLKQHLRSIVLESTSSRDGVSSFQFVFSGLKSDASLLQTEIRKIGSVKTINFFLDRPGGIR